MSKATAGSDHFYLFASASDLYLHVRRGQEQSLWHVSENEVRAVKLPDGRPLAGAGVESWLDSMGGLISFRLNQGDRESVYRLNGTKAMVMTTPDSQPLTLGEDDAVSIQCIGQSHIVAILSKSGDKLFLLKDNALQPLLGLDGEPLALENAPQWWLGQDGEVYGLSWDDDWVDRFGLRLSGNQLVKSDPLPTPDAVKDAKLSIQRLPSADGTLVCGTSFSDDKRYLWVAKDGKAHPVLDTKGAELAFTHFHLGYMAGHACIVGRRATTGGNQRVELFVFEKGRARSLGNAETPCEHVRMDWLPCPMLVDITLANGSRVWMVPHREKLVPVRDAHGEVFDPKKASYVWDASGQLAWDLDVDSSPIIKLEGDRLFWLESQGNAVRHDLPDNTVGDMKFLVMIERAVDSADWVSARLGVLGSKGVVHPLSGPDGPLKGRRVDCQAHDGKLWVLVNPFDGGAPRAYLVSP